MAFFTAASKADFQQQLRAALAQHVGDEALPQVALFAEQFFGIVSLDELTQRRLGDLAGALRTAGLHNVELKIYPEARHELLNETMFRNLAHARIVIAAWAADYNTERPHSALDYQTPADYARTLTAAIARPAARDESSAPSDCSACANRR